MTVPLHISLVRLRHGAELHGLLMERVDASDAERFVLDMSLEDLRDLAQFEYERFDRRRRERRGDR